MSLRDCTRPESNYSLSKHLEEQLANQLVRWNPEVSIQTLRFSNVMEPAEMESLGLHRCQRRSTEPEQSWRDGAAEP
ncbi:hypothetical protein GCM10027421_16820 [Microbacterium shaanxiense]